MLKLPSYLLLRVPVRHDPREGDYHEPARCPDLHQKQGVLLGACRTVLKQPHAAVVYRLVVLGPQSFLQILLVVEVSIDGDGDFVQCVEDGDYLVPLGGAVAEQHLEGGAGAVGLHFAEKSALLALDAVEDAGDVVEVLLVHFDVRILALEECCISLIQGPELHGLHLSQQLAHQLSSLQVLGNVVSQDDQVLLQDWDHLLHRPEQQFVQEEQVADPVGVGEYPAVILVVVEVEGRVELVRPGRGLGDVLVEPGQVRRDGGVQPRDYLVEHLLLQAHLAQVADAPEAVLLVDELPDVLPVVLGEGLDVGVHVEVLALVIFLILDMPDPATLRLVPLLRPYVLGLLGGAADLVGDDPVLRDVLLVAPADSATAGFAQLIDVGQGALRVQVQPDQSKVLGLDQFRQQGRGFVIQLPQQRCLILCGRVRGQTGNQCHQSHEEQQGRYLESAIEHP